MEPAQHLAARNTGRRPIGTFVRPAAVATLLLSCLTVSGPSAVSFAQDRSNEADIEPLKAPLAYEGEFIEVTKKNTLRHRYHSNDFRKDLAFYLQRAAENSKGRTPGKIRIAEVVIKRFDIVARHAQNAGGKVEATCDIPDSLMAEIPAYEKIFSDFVFAASDGAMKIEWLKPIAVDKTITYDQPQDQPGGWWFNPHAVQDQLDFLKNFEPGSVDFFFFYLGIAKRKDNKQDFYPIYGGMAYGNQEIKGARVLVLNDHELARGIHEWGHHIFDTTIQETEGITVTRGHGLFDAGYTGNSLGWQGDSSLNLGPCMAYYRDCMRYFYTRDMWERWRIRPPHVKPHEPFSGGAFRWSDVKGDFWFRLPRLQKDELRALTGLKTLEVQAPESCLVFKVDPAERLESPRLDKDPVKDAALNNAVNFYAESCAVLKTQTGTWLLVTPPLVDVYVDMLCIRQESRQKLPVYGYVLEGLKALVALRLPDGFPMPADELGFFPVPPVTLALKGLSTPDGNTFQKSMDISLKPAMPDLKIRYTLDGSEPTASSALYTKPIQLEDTATLRAAFFDAAGQRLPHAELRSTYELCPLTARARGTTAGRTTPGGHSVFGESMTLELASILPGGKIRYTLDGKDVGADSPVYSEPLSLTATTTVKARYFDPAGKAKGTQWSWQYSNDDYKKDAGAGRTVTIHPLGLAAGSDEFFNAMKIELKSWKAGTIRYTLDRSAPTAQSPAYAEPILVTNAVTIHAALFDEAGRQAGAPVSASYRTWRIEKNLTTGKPVTSSGPTNDTEKLEYAVDGEVNLEKYWGTIPAPQWLQVDLGKTCSLNRVRIVPYWDGDRYYQYTVEVSTDGAKWTQVVDATKNTVPGTEAGYVHKFEPTPARYVKVNMLRNSANPAVHIVELRAYEAE